MSDKYQECDLCMRHLKGVNHCYPKGKCRQWCKANGGKPHAMDLCMDKLKEANPYNKKDEAQQVQPTVTNYCPDLVQENINGVAAKAHRATVNSNV